MISDYDVIEAMLKYGGSFIQSLARCWQAGDYINQEKLKTAFPEYWSQYSSLAEAEKNARLR